MAAATFRRTRPAMVVTHLTEVRRLSRRVVLLQGCVLVVGQFQVERRRRRRASHTTSEPTRRRAWASASRGEQADRGDVSDGSPKRPSRNGRVTQRGLGRTRSLARARHVTREIPQPHRVVGGQGAAPPFEL
jgi:hypothetical protein